MTSVSDGLFGGFVVPLRRVLASDHLINATRVQGTPFGMKLEKVTLWGGTLAVSLTPHPRHPQPQPQPRPQPQPLPPHHQTQPMR